MKYLLRFLQWLVLSLIGIVFQVTAMVLINWWAVFLVRPVRADEWPYESLDEQWKGVECGLPRWLYWVGPINSTLDTGWTKGYLVANNLYSPLVLPTYWMRKWFQLRWLYRLTGYAFLYRVLGIRIELVEWKVVKEFHIPGEKRVLMCVNPSKGYWCFIHQTKTSTYKLGWDMGRYYDFRRSQWEAITTHKPWGPQWRTMVTYRMQPRQGNTFELFS